MAEEVQLTDSYMPPLDRSPKWTVSLCYCTPEYAWPTISPSGFPESISRSQTVATRYRWRDRILALPFLYRTCLISSSRYIFSFKEISQPSASVVPLTSTTCIKASAWRRSSRNLLPSPLPSCAPGTRPATSNNSIGTDRRPSWHPP
jgi:hypothetical protein